MAIKTKDSKEDLTEKKLGMDIIDNMGYQAQKEKNMEMAGGIKFKDLKDVFPCDYPIKQLDLFNKLLQKENQES